MDFLTPNLNAIKKHHPKLFALINGHFRSAGQAQKTTLFPFENTGFFNITYSSQNGSSHTLYAEPPEVTNTACRDALSSTTSRLIILLGFGLGYHVRDYAQTLSSRTRDVLIVEPNLDLFVSALKITDWTKLFSDERFEFLVGIDEENLLPAAKSYLLNRERLIYSDQRSDFELPNQDEAAKQYHKSFQKALTIASEQVSDSYLIRGEDNFIGLHNLLQNITKQAPLKTFYSLKNQFKDQKAIVIGAGPSLKKQLAELKAAEDKFVLFCTDAALKSVIAAGITPHFVVLSERVHRQKYLFEGLPTNLKSVLLCTTVIHPEALRAYPGPVMLTSRPATFSTWLWPENEHLFFGLGVSSMAYCLACFAGCSEIILLGQNFAYDVSDQTAYADTESAYLNDVDLFKMESHDTTVASHSGKPLKTHAYWKKFLGELQEHIQQFQIKTTNVIEFDQGANIAHTKQVNPSDFWPQTRSLPDSNISAKIQEIISVTNDDDLTKTKTETLLKKTISYLQQLNKEAAKTYSFIIEDFYSNLLMTYKKSELQERYPSHFKTWQEMIGTIIDLDRSLFYLFVNCVFGSDHIRALKEREAIDLSQEDLTPQLYAYFFKTCDWLHHLMGWTTKLTHELESLN